jgi:hypothetical protein
MKITISWDVMPCSSVEVQHFGGMHCLHLQVQRTTQANNSKKKMLTGSCNRTAKLNADATLHHQAKREI